MSRGRREARRQFTGVPVSKAAGADGADMGAIELQSVPKLPDKSGPPVSGPTGVSGPTPDPGIIVGRIFLNRKLGTATAIVKYPRSGRLLLSGPKITSRRVRASGAGTVGLPFRSRGKAAKSLRKAGSARVRVNVRFFPFTGAPDTVSRTITLIKKKPKKRR